jgi:hypothetical protein
MTVVDWRSILHSALTRARGGDSMSALSDLDTSIEEAVRADDAVWVGRLARNAGVIAAGAKNEPLAIRYYRIAAQYQPSDPLVCIALATLLWEANQRESRTWISKARELANAANDANALEIIATWQRNRSE